MTIRSRKYLFSAAGLCAALTLAGCGAEVAASETGQTVDGYPVTVENCETELTLAAAPQRTVVNDINMTEMMFALGLGEQMAGYIVSPGHSREMRSSPWSADFDSVPQLGEAMNKELIQGADADLVFAGWNYGFSDSSGVNPAALADVGIPSYLLTESCRQDGDSARGIMDPIEALYTDLANLGRLYGVSDRADALIAGYQAQIAGVAAAIPADRTPPRVFLYDSGTDQPLTVGSNAAASDVISHAGGENIFGDIDDSWTRATFEAASDRDPEVILIVDYGVGPANTVEAKEAFLRANPLMATTTAVKEGRFFALPYSALTEGPRNPQAIVDFAAYLNEFPW